MNIGILLRALLFVSVFSFAVSGVGEGLAEVVPGACEQCHDGVSSDTVITVSFASVGIALAIVGNVLHVEEPTAEIYDHGQLTDLEVVFERNEQIESYKVIRNVGYSLTAIALAMVLFPNGDNHAAQNSAGSTEDADNLTFTSEVLQSGETFWGGRLSF